MIEINANTDQVLRALNDALSRSENLEPAYKSIGEALVASTQRRFQDRQDPEGHAWAALSSVTRERKGHNRQLEGESKQLARQIHYNASSDGVEVGSTMEYAAMMHFGGKKSEFPHLWGDIPARPFLGLSADDADEIIDILQDFLTLSS
jgi:phage virion morphogenesis protein